MYTGSRAAGWSSGWKWNSSICKVGVAVEAARLIQALERGCLPLGGQQGAWSASASASNALQYTLDRHPVLLQCNALLCSGLGSLARSSQLDFCVPVCLTSQCATPASNHPPQYDNEHCQEVSADTGHHDLKALLSLLKGALRSKHGLVWSGLVWSGLVWILLDLV